MFEGFGKASTKSKSRCKSSLSICFHLSQIFNQLIANNWGLFNWYIISVESTELNNFLQFFILNVRNDYFIVEIVYWDFDFVAKINDGNQGTWVPGLYHLDIFRNANFHNFLPCDIANFVLCVQLLVLFTFLWTVFIFLVHFKDVSWTFSLIQQIFYDFVVLQNFVSSQCLLQKVKIFLPNYSDGEILIHFLKRWRVWNVHRSW